MPVPVSARLRRPVRRLARRFLLLGGVVGSSILAFAPLVIRGSTEGGRVAQGASSSRERLRNGGFEEAGVWFPDPGGFEWAPGEGREGSTAIACRNGDEAGTRGAFQRIEFAPPTDFPLIVSGWSRCEEVEGALDGGYSLYVDVERADGSVLTGQTAPFPGGTRSWQRAEIRLPQLGPVRALLVHCLFRGHRGRVWFDDLSVLEEAGGPGAVAFEGAPVVMGGPTRRASPDPSRTVTLRRDGLSLSWLDNRITSFKVDGQEMAGDQPSGFFVRDVSKGGDFYGFRDGRCGELGLHLERRFLAGDDHLAVEGRLCDRTGQDRAITLVFALPLDLTGWRWGDDLRRSRAIAGRDVFSNLVPIPCGATGTLSRYPLAAATSDRHGIGWAVDLGRPCQARLSYHAATRQVLVAYDFGLVHDSVESPGRVDFRFFLFRFDPEEGFRGALQAFYGIFADSFVARCRDAGLWLPFQKLADIKDWKDFGFAFHEGTDDAAFDEVHGLRPFRYSEPGLKWTPLPPGAPPDEASAGRALEERSGGPDGDWVRAVRASGIRRQDGSLAVRRVAAPWCDGVAWSLNPSPRLGNRPTAASLLWNEEVRRTVYGPEAPARVAGEFIDSVEGHLMEDLDFDRDHLRLATAPPSFSREAARPVLFKGQWMFEYLKEVGRELHAMDRWTFGNGAPRRFAFLAPWLDVAGMEVDWFPDGAFRPSSDDEMSFWRTMSYQKPYLLLINTDFTKLTAAGVEQCLRRGLFYGMFPSFFSANAQDQPYWKNESWVERDRPTFKKYVPLIRRAARAGWQPLTRARCNNPDLWVERYGPDGGGIVYFTLLNPTSEQQTAVLQLGSPGGSRLRELVSGVPVQPESGGIAVRLAPGEVWLIERTPASK